MSLLDRVAEALTEAFGAPATITDHRALGGGCINEALRVETDHGPVFVKSNGDPIDDLFSAEAAGLTAMRNSGTSLAIPEVLAHEDPAPGRAGFLVLELMAPGRRKPDFAAALGRGLAELHRCSSPRGFGFDRRTYCGTTPQPNRWGSSWIAFYRDQRLGHLLRRLVDAGHFGRSDRKLTEQLLSRLDDRLAAPEEPPALIHGDLWSGNLHADAAGHPALIDPAVYFGHREAEIGMMTLFGGFSGGVFAAYEEVWPLAPGWRDRNPLYELYHVMNHACLFGGGYVGQSLGIIRRYA